jgi:hypothetical protein
MKNRKKNVSAIFLAALLPLMLMSHAGAATTYTLSGSAYNQATLFGTYIGTTGITGSFTTASPLPPSLNGAAIAGSGGLGLVTGWSFNDGLFTYTDVNSALWQDGKNAAGSFSVSTDSAGNITSFFIVLTIPRTGAVLGQPTEFMFLGFSGPGTSGAVAAADCVALAADGSCAGYSGATDGAANSLVPGTATFSSSAPPCRLNKKGNCRTPSKNHP